MNKYNTHSYKSELEGCMLYTKKQYHDVYILNFLYEETH